MQTSHLLMPSTFQKRIVIIGATSLMAEHCARLWIKDAAVHLILISRNASKLDVTARDLRIRSPKSLIEPLVWSSSDFTDPHAIEKNIHDISLKGNIDIVLIAHGVLLDQKSCQENISTLAETLFINGLSPVLLAEVFAGMFEKQGAGKLAVISSVAGDRGRRSNYSYGAAKGLVSHYLEGLQHRFAFTRIQIILIKPGPTETPMTLAMASPPKHMADPAETAACIVKGIERGKKIIYAPFKWAVIMMILRHIPFFIFRHLNI